MLPIKIRQSVLPEDQLESAIAGLVAAGVNPWVARALAVRGVADPKIARGDYRIEHFAQLKGITQLSGLLADAIQHRQPITVVADYDCDGATACAVAVTGLHALGAVVDFVVPNRFEHGYGLTPSVVDLVAERKPKPRWIVTVDNGIASNAGVAHANHLGIGVLVTDHHLPGPELPAAAAIVNPNQPGCLFPSKNLAGCGVMYYVLAATQALLVQRNALPNRPILADWLDIVALGTVADVVKLDANNRWLVRQGLARIRQGITRPGVAALFEVSKRNAAWATSQDFGFSLGPRINAAGRLKDMSIGIQCLLSPSRAEADPLAQQLFDLNEERKNIEGDMKVDALQEIDLSGQEGRFTRVVYGPAFHEGVIGIVAGRIKESSNTPVIVFAPAKEPGLIKGSARSIPGLHLRDALDLVHKRGSDIMVKFGGHAMAAGLTIHHAKLDQFMALFEQAVQEMMGGRLQEKVLVVDGELPPEALTVQTAGAFSDEVWGQGFEEPIWLGEVHIRSARLVGKEQNHLKMEVSMGRGGPTFDAMQFFCAELPSSESVRLAYKLSLNEFQGKQSAQLLVVDKD